MHTLSGKLLVIGGFGEVDGGYVSYTELFDLEDQTWTCLNDGHYDLPVGLEAPSGNALTMEDGHSFAIVCGGKHEEGMERNCFKLGDRIPFAQLSEARFGVASVPIYNGKTLWVTGGADSTFFRYDRFHDLLLSSMTICAYSSTTDYISLPGSSITVGQLPFTVAFHCMVPLNDQSLLLVGGYREGYVSSNETWIYDTESLKWTQTMAFLSEGRGCLTCGKFYDSAPEFETTFYIVATGGHVSSDSIYVNTTELVRLEDSPHVVESFLSSTWELGPGFPYQVICMASATTLDRKRLIMIGGGLEPGRFSSDIFQLQCWSQTCQWSLLGQTLQVPRLRAVAIILPSTDMQCNQEN